MGPGFHLRYAGRLAWRYRLLLALGFALLGLLHPGFALASPLALLLPSRLFAGRALKEISRVSLAYPTALAFGEERLWAEARRVRLEPPPFPWGLLLAYALVLLLLLVLAAWRTGGGGDPWSLPGLERPLEPRGGEEARPLEGAPEGGEGQAGPQDGTPVGRGGDAVPQDPREGQPVQGEGGASAGDRPGAGEPTRQGALGGQGEGPEGPAPGARGDEGGPPAPGAGAPPRGEPGEGARGGEGAGGPDPLAAEAGEASSPGGQDQGGGLRPGGEGPAPALGEAGEVPPIPLEGSGQGLLTPGGEGGEEALPSPWAGGRPPERVQRGAEVYLERTPLSPEARELLRRYFGVP
ncbi:hypothetical protein [Thermus sediminis]|uniref:hypothetical protein n=1 Tax=Thermus sediminis TaxID=1761908 RepID=UPI000E3EA5E0|nr:hypothetical protein [Thermus sediminis]